MALGENANAAATAEGINAEIEKITDIIASYGIMSTPGLVVDEKVLSSGHVLKPAEIAALLREAAV